MSSPEFLTTNNRKISCKTCCKSIAKTRRFISCHQCQSNFHVKCFKTDSNTSGKNKNKSTQEICIQCQQKNKKCGICVKIIAKNHRYVNCSKCFGKFHLKCNEIDDKTYNQLKINQSILCIN